MAHFPRIKVFVNRTTSNLKEKQEKGYLFPHKCGTMTAKLGNRNMSHEEKEIVSMRILGLIFDPNLNTTVVVLLDPKQERVLPIWIGPMEGNAIAIGMEKVNTPRPMTHDLMKNLLDEFKVEVKKVVVTELKDDTFYAIIHLGVDGKELEIDSRPSDAIALAVRVEAPIYCAEQVLEAAADLGLLKQRSDFDESEDLKKWLENLKPDDFGKYKM